MNLDLFKLGMLIYIVGIIFVWIFTEISFHGFYTKYVILGILSCFIALIGLVMLVISLDSLKQTILLATILTFINKFVDIILRKVVRSWKSGKIHRPLTLIKKKR